MFLVPTPQDQTLGGVTVREGVSLGEFPLKDEQLDCSMELIRSMWATQDEDLLC